MTRPLDLLVIGGGINGAGIARDAALRGLSTALVEQDDLCSATTRWSSRLIHGGLRYLEYGELGLVHESLRERELLFRNAPHLVRPLPLLIPVYRDSRRGLSKISFGLWVYDMLATGRSVPGYQRLSREEALTHAPGLATDGLLGAALYHDGQVPFVERLVVENALAAREAGATVLTHTRVSRLLLYGRKVCGVELEEEGGRRRELAARSVINASGPWVDRLLHSLPRPPARLMGPTRGTHIVLARFPGAPQAGCYLEARSDGRPFFVLPWNGLFLVGTTDIRDDTDPARVRPAAEESDYLLRELAGIFPKAGLSPASVLYRYAGLRPLPRQGRRFTGSITRRHQLRHHAPLVRGLYSVIGGKITTYRSLAEQAVDRVCRQLGLGQLSGTTGGTPLPGAGERSAVLGELAARWPALSAASGRHLWEVYGSRAPGVAALIEEDPALALPICPHSHAVGAEVLFALQHEAAMHLDDVLFRRCMAGLSPDLGAAALEPALAVAARHLGWDALRQAAERARCEGERALLSAPG
ncbi:MAG: glycerol-3-phosphate dehydrogenase/oxidase [Chromatiales bacterium]|nr:glycerol-3-phosphate dehydrogenase/oxidase [Chromatiales bacterium]